MPTPETDQRSLERRARDEQIAAELRMAPLELPPDATPSPLESHLAHLRRRPVAVVGVVIALEHGKLGETELEFLLALGDVASEGRAVEFGQFLGCLLVARNKPGYPKHFVDRA